MIRNTVSIIQALERLEIKHYQKGSKYWRVGWNGNIVDDVTYWEQGKQLVFVCDGEPISEDCRSQFCQCVMCPDSTTSNMRPWGDETGRCPGCDECDGAVPLGSCSYGK